MAATTDRSSQERWEKENAAAPGRPQPPPRPNAIDQLPPMLLGPLPGLEIGIEGIHVSSSSVLEQPSPAASGADWSER